MYGIWIRLFALLHPGTNFDTMNSFPEFRISKFESGLLQYISLAFTNIDGVVVGKWSKWNATLPTPDCSHPPQHSHRYSLSVVLWCVGSACVLLNYRAFLFPSTLTLSIIYQESWVVRRCVNELARIFLYVAYFNVNFVFPLDMYNWFILSIIFMFKVYFN